MSKLSVKNRVLNNIGKAGLEALSINTPDHVQSMPALAARKPEAPESDGQ
jgi:hypothetical protein